MQGLCSRAVKSVAMVQIVLTNELCRIEPTESNLKEVSIILEVYDLQSVLFLMVLVGMGCLGVGGGRICFL